MFRIYKNTLSDEELITLEELWSDMQKKLEKKAKCRKQCEECKYYTLCRNMYSTSKYIFKAITKRESKE